MRAGRSNLFAVKMLGACAVLSVLAVYVSAQTAPTTRPRGGAAAANSGQPIVTGGLGEANDIKLLVNKSVVLTTSRPYRRLSVGQPDIFEANAIGPTKILVTAKKAGSTQLIIWDDSDNSQMIDVLVQSDLRALREMYPVLFPSAKIDVVNNEGTIALTGHVPNLETAEQASTLAQSYGNKVLNLLEIAGGQQIMIQVRFAEVSRSASSQLGVNLGWVNGSGAFGASNVGLQQFTLKENGNGVSQFADTPPGQAVTAFGRGFVGGNTLEAYVSALRNNSLLRVLAEPNLTATSGQEASFLAGGEYPVPIAQGGSGANGNTAITVEFKEFGVRLNFVPVVLGNGRIRMKVKPEVSDLDFSTAVQFGGFVIPGLTTRRVQTTVEVAEGQTFALAGLLNNNVAANKDVTPLLGDIPVIGALFRSVRYQRRETELVVLVTPRLAGSMKPGEVPLLPGERWRHPSEAELFLNQDMGGPAPAADKNEPPRPYIGRYGFAPATQPSAKTK
ncbi:MAG TPA: type II and III secretion system protein family protein [Tepidisphaeraceae bacterium]|jgi:pilus assembly protein CpaC